MVILDAAQAVLSTIWVPRVKIENLKNTRFKHKKHKPWSLLSKRKKFLYLLSFLEHFKTTCTSFHSFSVSESCKQVSFVKLMPGPYTGVFPLKKMHIIVPCWPPISSWCRGRWKNNQDVNQGKLQIKEQKIKTVSAIYALWNKRQKLHQWWWFS